MKNTFCGIDLGGTTINIGLVTPAGQIIVEQNLPSRVSKGVDHVVNQITIGLKKCTEAAGVDCAIQGVGVGVAGLIDVKNGVLCEATNFPGWKNVPLAATLSALLKLPVTVDNDANVAALGEYAFGAGRGYAHLMMVTLGTGVGGGLILDGMIYHGANGAAGELGHITIQKDGPLCACGRRGCVEAFVGTLGLIREVRERLADFPKSTLRQYDITGLTPKDIYTEAKKGDELALQVFRRAGESLGYGIGNVVNLLNIQRIVVGGGVALAGDLLINSAQRVLTEFALNNSKEPVQIVRAALGEHAGLVGAASLAMAAV